jgi:hypothetical protein
MIKTILLSPPVVFATFLLLSYALYRLGGRLAAPGEEHVEKHLPYTGGENLPPPPSRLTYHAFFRLALMFGILHVAALVVSTVPMGRGSHHVAMIYLIGIDVSVIVLASEGRGNI